MCKTCLPVDRCYPHFLTRSHYDVLFAYACAYCCWHLRELCPVRPTVREKLVTGYELARHDSGWGITGRAELWSENLSWVFSEISDVALCLTCVYGNRQQPSVQHQLRVLVFRLFAAKRYSVIQYRWTVRYCMSIFSVGSYTSSCIEYIAI